MKKFGDMQLSDLRDECRKRGAKIDGRKQDLVERLEAYARNSNFGSTTTLEKEYAMTVPDSSLYKDINLGSPMPIITERGVAAYLSHNGAKLTTIAKDMYKESDQHQRGA
ncbi:uncharacterized protein [Littorina saxatilis]|uniref:uncharacterized protein n=1 Tax=Littorina saxatilis TaxID=31220 RepID=UPI0038B440B9